MKKILIIAIVVFLILLGFSIWGYIYGKNQIENLTTEKQSFQLIATERSEIIARQEQEIITLKAFKEQDTELIKQLRKNGIKNVNTIINLQTENKRLKLELSYKPDSVIDTLVIHDGPNLKTYLKVPIKAGFKDQWLQLDGTVKTTGFTMDSIIVYSEPQIVIGWSKKFLKKSKPIIDFSDKNPYTKVISMENKIIVKPVPFYRNPWFYRAEGVVVLFGVLEGVKAIK